MKKIKRPHDGCQKLEIKKSSNLYLNVLILLFSSLLSLSLQAQTLAEKQLLQSPKLSINLGADYFSNLQKEKTYQNQQGSSLSMLARYRLNDTYTLLGSTGFSQSLTQENRSDLINSSISVSRTPYNIGNKINFRPTLSLILPTNEIQRNKDSLLGALQFTGNNFIQTNTNFILGGGARLRMNSHRYSISAINGVNIQYLVTPYATIGYGLGKFQFITQSSYTYSKTYGGKNHNLFGFDQSVTYIPSQQLSFSIGHSNIGNVLAKDSMSSNVQFFNTRTSIIYLSAVYNY